MALLHTAANERRKRVAAMVIQERYRGFLEDRKKDHAARVIQRFFLMVKREVDNMVKATKRRKIWRKKMKNRNNRVEDDLLEDAWVSALSSCHDEPSFISSSKFQNENVRANVQCHSDRGMVSPMASRPGTQTKRNNNTALDWKNRPPRPMIQLHNDDDRSEFSGLTTSSATLNHRVPISRWKRLNSREMDEDLELEEAFIDAEIFTSKERSVIDKKAVGPKRQIHSLPRK